jgi:hypothetical protein
LKKEAARFPKSLLSPSPFLKKEAMFLNNIASISCFQSLSFYIQPLLEERSGYVSKVMASVSMPVLEERSYVTKVTTSIYSPILKEEGNYVSKVTASISRPF